MDLVNDLIHLQEKLNASIRALANNGKALAQAEMEYKICLRQEALKLRNEKDMPVTLINQIVYGIKDVANKRFERDVAETMKDVAQEQINVLKLQIRILEEQIQREWGQKQ